MQKVIPFLMFEGAADAAMNFYVSLFREGRIIEIIRFTNEFPGKEGLVKQARFSIQNQEFMCIDSPVKHDFTFTPSISLFISCETAAEVDFFLQDSPKVEKYLCRSIATHSALDLAGARINSGCLGRSG